MCGLHYAKWRRWGDPLYVWTPPVGVGVKQCSIDGCEKLVKARGWCSAHHTKFLRWGDPLHRMPGEIRDGKRICPSCRQDLPLTKWGKGQGECKECMRRRAADYRLRNPRQPIEGTPKECDGCGVTFMANGRRSRYCSPRCSEAYKNKANWKHLNKRRARMRGALIETFDRREIFERDGWVCQICDTPVDRSASFPDPMSPSLDHIVPIARGGKHSRANAQTAHFHCNCVKGERLMSELGAVA